MTATAEGLTIFHQLQEAMQQVRLRMEDVERQALCLAAREGKGPCPGIRTSRGLTCSVRPGADCGETREVAVQNDLTAARSSTTTGT